MHNTNKSQTTTNKEIFKKIKIIAINVNSIIKNQRRASLMNIIKKQNPDIILLGETKLNKNHILRFENYNVIRSDRDDKNPGGGTAIIIRKSIKYSEITLTGIEEKKILEHTIIKLNIKAKDTLYIIAAYAKCGSQKEFIPNIKKIFSSLELDKLENYYILAGDLNAKHTDWKNSNNNPRGIALKKWIGENILPFKLRLLSTKYPSYPNGNSFLDIVLADIRLTFQNTDNNCDLENIPYDSDHNAVKFNISLKDDNGLELETNNIKHKYDFKKTDWKKFSSTLRETIIDKIPNNRNLTNSEINEYLQEIDNKILDTMEKIIPKIKEKNSVNSYINEKILKLQKQKNKILTKIHHLRRKWPITNDRLMRNLKKELDIIKTQLKIEFTTSINNYWKNKILNISKKDSAKMFPQINAIFRKKGIAEVATLKIPTDSPILNKVQIDINKLDKDGDGNALINALQDKLDIIGAHFASINNRNFENNRPQLNNIINNEVKSFKEQIETEKDDNATICTFSDNNTANNPTAQNEYKHYFTNTDDLWERFRKLNNKKSFGLDKIPNIVLKHLPQKLIYNYTVIFNNLLNYSWFPHKWKTAKVVAILKKDKNKMSPTSYRPISLLPNISKVFETIINDHITNFCRDNNIIPESQFGFQRNHSTIHALNRLTSDINWALNGKQCLGACLIDLEKAFDSIWLDGLLYKLINKKFPKHLIKIIWSMISGRALVTACGEIYSKNVFKIDNRLQQGTVNSPILFNIYTCDLLRMFNLNEPKNPQAIAFADDLIIYAADSWPSRIQQTLQSMFHKLEFYYETWKLKINIDKCETILFRPSLGYANRNVRKNYKSFRIESSPKNNAAQRLPHKNMVRYLGINLDERLHYKIHIVKQLKKATQIFTQLKRLFYSKYLHPEIKIICYQLLIRPIITYGCPIWYNINASLMEKIRVFERKCVRVCMNMNRSAETDYTKYINNQKLYDTANIPRIDSFIIDLIREHFRQASLIKQNSLIYGALYPNPMYHDRALTNGFIPPEAFLYLDQRGYIQDDKNVPLIYHFPRRNNNKKLEYPQFASSENTNIPWRYSMVVPNKEKLKKYKNKKNYWWNTDI